VGARRETGKGRSAMRAGMFIADIVLAGLGRVAPGAFLSAAVLAAAYSLARQQANAETIFELDPTSSASLIADLGVGQGVAVTTTQTISDFAFFAYLPDGGDLKFMIWDGGNSTLLDTFTKTFPASSTPSWLDAGPLSFTLAAGSTYHFGFIPDNDATFGFLGSRTSYTSNGLTALGNSGYADFSSPVALSGGDGGVQIALQISAGPVPEPSTWAMMLVGFAGLGYAGLRAQRRSVTARV
jgi:hypothetical protein